MQNKDMNKAAHIALQTLFRGESLDKEAAADVFDQVVSGDMDNITLAAVLTALKMKGETPQEIAGAASALIRCASPFPRPDYAFADIVGTGGDGHDTINISSAAAIVAASCGVKVAKHGNRSVSSKSGSADLYRELGMNLAMSPETARRCLDQAGVCFLFAPQYHAGIRHAMEVRTTLKTRTLFNLLGPLANPARPTHIMIGVYHPDLLQPFAKTLQLLGYEQALVVHGDGLDELALHGPSSLVEVSGANLIEHTLSPQDFGVPSFPLSAIKGAEPEHNKALIKAVLAGHGQPAHEAAVAINAGALLKLTGKAENFEQGTKQALDVIRAGIPLNTIQHAAALSQES